MCCSWDLLMAPNVGLRSNTYRDSTITSAALFLHELTLSRAYT